MNFFAFYKAADSKEVAESIQSGILRFGSLKSYTKYENQNGEKRGDTDEGLVGILDGKKIIVQLGEHIVQDVVNVKIKSNVDNYFAFCLGAMLSPSRFNRQ